MSHAPATAASVEAGGKAVEIVAAAETKAAGIHAEAGATANGVTEELR